MCVGVGLRARVYMNIRINNNYTMRMFGEQGQLKRLVNLTSNFRFFRGVSDVDCVDVEASAMLAEGSDSRLLTFAFLLGQTQSPFANKSLVACNVNPSVIRLCKVLILTLQRKPQSNARFVSIPPCPCVVPNVFATLDR